MKPWIKNTMISLFVLTSVSAMASAVITLAEVNQKVAELLASFNNETTSAVVRFSDLKVDQVRALDFGMDVSYSKKGLENEFRLKFEDLEYHFGNGSQPTAQGKLSLELDLVKAYGQETLDALGEDLAGMFQELAADYTKKYGAAAAVDLVVDQLEKNQDGHLVSAKMKANIQIDFNKLPAEIKVEDVEFKALSFQMGAHRHGVDGQFKVILNPLNKGFKEDQTGFKELIEKLLSEDPETYNIFREVVSMVDELAKSIVDQPAE